MPSHHARIERSPRLKRVLEVLSDREWHSSLEIAIRAGTVAPGSCISELRSNGYVIDCRFREVDLNGRRVYEYRLRETPRTQFELPLMRTGRNRRAM